MKTAVDDDEAIELTESWKVEVENLKLVSSPYVIRVYGAFEDRFYAYILMEFCEKGSLRKFVKQREKSGKPLSVKVSPHALFSSTSIDFFG
jgi:serine/threonine protein kinase